MISVCIPVYNFPVKALLAELRVQIPTTGVPIEIILIDDGSEEEYRKANRESSSGLVYIELEHNVGRARIRNLFAGHAKYDHLLFMDCDSRIPGKDFLKSYVEAAGVEGENVICGGRLVYPERPGRDKRLRWKYGKKREGLTAAVRSIHPYRSFMTNNFMLPLKVLEQVKFDERIEGYGHEDTLFGFALKRKGIGVSHIDNPVLNGDLETNREYLLKTREGILNLVKILNFIDNPEEFSAEVTLLRYYWGLKSRGYLPWIRFLYDLTGTVVENLLAAGFANMKLFDFFKLGCMLRALGRDPTPADSE